MIFISSHFYVKFPFYKVLNHMLLSIGYKFSSLTSQSNQPEGPI